MYTSFTFTDGKPSKLEQLHFFTLARRQYSNLWVVKVLALEFSVYTW